MLDSPPCGAWRTATGSVRTPSLSRRSQYRGLESECATPYGGGEGTRINPSPWGGITLEVLWRRGNVWKMHPADPRHCFLWEWEQIPSF